MIWAIIVLIVIFWLFGFAFQVGGDLIHFLLVLALIGVIYNVFFKKGK